MGIRCNHFFSALPYLKFDLIVLVKSIAFAMVSQLFTDEFLNWLQRSAPATYRRLNSLFRMESVSRWRVMNGHYDETQEDPYLDEINVMNYSELQLVLIFRQYSPVYLEYLVKLNGLSTHHVWKMNGHDH